MSNNNSQQSNNKNVETVTSEVVITETTTTKTTVKKLPASQSPALKTQFGLFTFTLIATFGFIYVGYFIIQDSYSLNLFLIIAGFLTFRITINSLTNGITSLSLRCLFNIALTLFFLYINILCIEPTFNEKDANKIFIQAALIIILGGDIRQYMQDFFNKK